MKRQSPFTTCYCCGVTRQKDYTRLINIGPDETHLNVVDVCDDCAITAAVAIDHTTDNADAERQLKANIKEMHNAIRIERDDGGKCCPECFVASCDTNLGLGWVAVPDACGDEECDCHNIITSTAVDANGIIRDIVEAK